MKIEPQKEVKAVKMTPQDFIKEYEALCERAGYRIVVSPAWVSTNHGSFELVLQQTVGELPKK